MKPELKMDYNFTARWRQPSPAEISSGKFNRTFANVIFVIIVVDETIGPIAAAAAAGSTCREEKEDRYPAKNDRRIRRGSRSVIRSQRAVGRFGEFSQIILQSVRSTIPVLFLCWEGQKRFKMKLYIICKQ